MAETYYCPTCKQEIERVQACGAVQYFCNHCKGLVSSKKVLTKEQLADEVTAEEKESR